MGFVALLTPKRGPAGFQPDFALRFRLGGTRFAHAVLPHLSMSNSESDGPSDGEWDDRGELAWNEFDWERYLREQDEVIHRYVLFYDKAQHRADRIDHVAHQMGWDDESWNGEEEASAPAKEAVESEAPTATSPSEEDGSDYDDSDPYTLHKNPIFIATKAIYLSLKRNSQRLAADSAKLPAHLPFSLHATLYRGEEQAVIAIQALDFGDYAMAISLFKRALRELNHAFALLSDRKLDSFRPIVALREETFPKLFDLREIWLRVMTECREELDRPTEDDDDEE